MHQRYVYVLNEITLRPYAIKITATLALLQVFTSVHDHVLMHVLTNFFSVYQIDSKKIFFNGANLVSGSKSL